MDLSIRGYSNLISEHMAMSSFDVNKTVEENSIEDLLLQMTDGLKISKCEGVSSFFEIGQDLF